MAEKKKNKPIKIKKKMGCPTKYDPKYCQMIIDYFSVKPYKIVNKKRIPCDLPTLEGFSGKINVFVDTLLNWRKEHPDFLRAIAKCKALQKHILITNGLQGLYQSNFAIFVTSNLTKFRQKKDIAVKKQIEDDDVEEIDKKIDELKKQLNAKS